MWVHRMSRRCACGPTVARVRAQGEARTTRCVGGRLRAGADRSDRRSGRDRVRRRPDRQGHRRLLLPGHDRLGRGEGRGREVRVHPRLRRHRATSTRKFASYWAASRANGIYHGAYQFFRPGQDPIAQADLLLSKIGNQIARRRPPAGARRRGRGRQDARAGRRRRQRVGRARHGRARPAADRLHRLLLLARQRRRGRRDRLAAVARAVHERGLPADRRSVDRLGVLAVHVDRLDRRHLRQRRRRPLERRSARRSRRSSARRAAAATARAPRTSRRPRAPRTAARAARSPRPAARSTTPTPASRRAARRPTCGTSPTRARAASCTGRTRPTTRPRRTSASGTCSSSRAVATRSRSTRPRPTRSPSRPRTSSTPPTATPASTIDQSASDGWQSLGEFQFADGGHQWVHLADNTGEPVAGNVQIVFDAVRVTRLDGSGPGSDQGSAVDDPMKHGGGCNAGGGASVSWALWMAASCAAFRRRSASRRR